MKAPQTMKAVEAPQVVGVQEVPGSNPGGPTKILKELQTADLYIVLFWSPTGVQNGLSGLQNGRRGAVRRFSAN